MARIAGVNIPTHKHIEIALTSVYGIGRTRLRVLTLRLCPSGELRHEKGTQSRVLLMPLLAPFRHAES